MSLFVHYYGMVRRQAGILAYNHIFWIVWLAFLVVIPLILLLKRIGAGGGPAAGVH